MNPADARCRFCSSSSIGSSTCPTCQERLFALAIEDEHNGMFGLVDVADAANYTSGHSSRVDRFGHYQLLTRPDGTLWELGRGSMGVTYKAFDTTLQCCVALKLINTQALFGERTNERFLREARAAAQLRHPNIASVFHLGSQNGAWFYSMEFIDGETLHDVVHRAGPLPWRQALEIIAQVGRALVAAHKQAYIHRDIKPSNVMLTAGGDKPTAKLIDFGLVKGTRVAPDDVAAERSYFIGTPQFASPEQIDLGEADTQSDIYSLGATFYFLLTGASPPTDTNARLTHLRRKYPGAVVALLETAIAPERSQRQASAADFLAACEQCLKLGRLHPNGSNARIFLRVAGLVVVVWLITVVLFPRILFPEKTAVRFNTPSDMPPSQNIEAYTAQVKADELAVKITEEDSKRAIALYERAIQLDPNYALAHAGLAEACSQGIRRGWLPPSRKRDALLSAQRAVALAPDAAQSHFSLGTVYSMQGFQHKAMAQMHRALELNSMYVPAMRAFAWFWLVSGKPEKALPWLQAAMVHDPYSAKGWATIGDAYKDLCADDEAETNFRKALDLDPTGLGALYALTHLEILRGHFDLAENLCLRGLALRPNDLFALTLEAQIALFRGDLSRAEELYRSLLPRHHTSDDIVFYGSIRCQSALAYIMSRTGRMNEAESFARDAEELDQDGATEGHQSWFDLSAVQATRGDLETAAKSFEEAVKRGWIDYRAAYVDPRFAELRTMPAFQETVIHLRESIGKARVEATARANRLLELTDYPID